MIIFLVIAVATPANVVIAEIAIGTAIGAVIVIVIVIVEIVSNFHFQF